MITAQTSASRRTSSTSSYVRIKTLGNAVVDREDEKGLEIDDEIASRQKEEPPTSQKTIPAQTTTSSSGFFISGRAQNIKERLREQSVACAVLLKADGSSEEIEYTSSSKQANELMKGRPTIVGELEEIGVIVIRSLKQSSGKVNPHTLPAPLCNEQFKGDYLLYRADSQGKAVDLTLGQYEKFVAKKKKETEESRKRFDPVDSQKIIAKTGFGSKSSVELAAVRSEFDKLIREDIAEKQNRSPTESEVEKRVEQAIQSLVDDLATFKNDSDYDPAEDEAVIYDGSGLEVVGKRIDKIYQGKSKKRVKFDIEEKEEYDTDADWRAEMVDAMKYVRERGRCDGRMLAEQIAETFYEMNGREATIEELKDVFERIQDELAYEAQDDIDDEMEDVDPEKVIESSTVIVEQDLVSRAVESYKICNECEPDMDELKDMVQRMALRMADRAVAAYVDAC